MAQKSLLKSSSVKQVIVGYFLLIIFIVCGLITSFLVSKSYQRFIVSQENKAKIVASNLALAAGDLMMVGEWDRLTEILQGVKKSDIELAYAFLLGNDGRCVATSDETFREKFLNKTTFEKKVLQVKEITMFKNAEEKTGIFEMVVPVEAAGQKMGTLRVGYTTKYISATLRGIVLVSLYIGIGVLLLGSIFYYFLIQFSIVNPLSSVKVVALNIAEGDLSQEAVEVRARNEIGILAESFTTMLTNLRNMVFQVRRTADKVAASSEEMSSSAQEVNSSTQEISNAITQVSKGSVTQAERVEEAFAIMEKFAVSLKQIVASAQTASQAVDKTSDRSEAGRVAAKETVEKIERLTVTVTDSVKIIQSLGQTSQQIGEITETITSIADQTNLLALNAAIEAARAGEAGRGFAVVAEEVRKLAEGSAEAVRKIGGLIRSIQSETNRAIETIQTSFKEVQEGKGQVAKIADLLSEINKMAQEANILTQQISTAEQQRLEEVERVVKAINEVATIAKESASTTQEITSSTEEQTASMQQMAAASQELARLALELKDLVGKFKLKEIKKS